MNVRAKSSPEPLLMGVALETAGATFSLDPLSLDRIREQYPEARGLPLVCFGYDNKQEFETRHASLWELAATLLTGLSPEQISRLGGVRLYQPVSGKVYWEWRPSPIKTG
jgi:hypothetical protein